MKKLLLRARVYSQRKEEFEETQAAFLNKDHKEVVDGLIDLIVIKIFYHNTNYFQTGI